MIDSSFQWFTVHFIIGVRFLLNNIAEMQSESERTMCKG